MLEDEEFWCLRRLDAIESLRQIAIDFPDLIESWVKACGNVGRLCPHCGSGRWTLLNGAAHRKGLMQCNDCRGQFSETTKTPRHRTRLSPDVWRKATDMVQASPWVPAKTLQRELGLGSYKTAWQLKRDVLAELMPA